MSDSDQNLLLREDGYPHIDVRVEIEKLREENKFLKIENERLRKDCTNSARVNMRYAAELGLVKP